MRAACFVVVSRRGKVCCIFLMGYHILYSKIYFYGWRHETVDWLYILLDCGGDGDYDFPAERGFGDLGYLCAAAVGV